MTATPSTPTGRSGPSSGLASLAFLVISGSTLTSLLSFARNLLIARMIPVEDFGIAATFAIAVTVMEMASSFGIHQFIVQNKDGDDAKFQATLQAFNLFRGVISALVLFFSAGWIANFMGLPDLAWAFQILAVVPICNGLIHYDIFRLMRHMTYLPSILATVVPAFVTLCMVWPLSLLFLDYRISLTVTVAQFGLMALISHVVAKRPYRLHYDRTVIRKALIFGWPLLINHVLLFAVFNGERVIVGREVGMLELGILSMGLTLTLTPILILASSMQRFFLPQLSAAQDDPERFAFLSAVVFQAILILATLFLVCVVFLGEPVVMLLLGERYSALIALLPLLGMMQFFRAVQNSTSVIPLSKGQTITETLANLVRVSVLPVSWYLATHGADIVTIIMMAILAEALGFTTLMVRMHRRIGLPFRALRFPVTMTVLVLALIMSHVFIPELAETVGLPVIVLGAVILMAGLVMSARELPRYVRQWRTT